MTRPLVFLALVLALVSCKGSPTDPFSGPARATLSGVLTGNSGYTVAGARIGLVNGAGMVAAFGESDGFGQYEIERIPTGHYTIHISTSIREVYQAPIDLRAGSNRYDVVLP